MVVALAALCALEARAHEVRPAYLELVQVSENEFDVGWKVPARGEVLRFGLYLRLPADCVDVTDPRGIMSGGAHVTRWRVSHPDALVGATIHHAFLSVSPGVRGTGPGQISIRPTARPSSATPSPSR